MPVLLVPVLWAGGSLLVLGGGSVGYRVVPVNRSTPVILGRTPEA